MSSLHEGTVPSIALLARPRLDPLLQQDRVAATALFPSLPAGITPEDMADARAVWEPVYGHALSDSDVIEILTNVRRLLDVLRPSVAVSGKE